MSRVGQRHTTPEMTVRRMLHARGWRYRLHGRGLPGTPDIVFPKLRAVLFVHGCFWHGHDCNLGRSPKSRPEYWGPKIKGNRSRDARKVRELCDMEWRVMTVWQCSLKDKWVALEQIERFLKGACAATETRPFKW